MNVSEERKITAGTISGVTLKSIDIEPSIIIEGKSYTASEFNKAVEMLKQPQLNDNQKMVFDYLKSNVEQGGKSVMYSIFLLGDWDSRIGAARNVDIAYCGLNGKQEAEVLAAFAQWGLEQEEEE